MLGEKHILISIDEDKATCFLVTVLLLQVFRRASTVGYSGILIIAYMIWAFEIGKKNSGFQVHWLVGIYLFFYTLLPLISLFETSGSEYLTALIRYGAMMPFVILSCLNLDIIYRNMVSILRIVAIIVFLSGILIIYQVFFGRIALFVDATERLGFERYGSLLGSTTAYGVASMAAIMSLHDFKLFNSQISRTMELTILVGGILCLSKAFFINLAVGYALIILFRNKNTRFDRKFVNKVLKSFVAIAIGAGVFYFLIRTTIIGDYLNNMLRYTFFNNYQGAESDLVDRLSVLPQRAFDYYSRPWYEYIVYGVGFRGYSGVLGLPDYPMCHNNYYDLILSQGILFFLTVIGLYMNSFFACIRRRDSVSIFVRQYILYNLANMAAGQATLLTPRGAVMFLLICSVLSHSSRYFGNEVLNAGEAVHEW